MKYKIVLVPFPFDDLLGIKVRPALCLTDSISPYNHLVISYITSQFSMADESTDVALLNSDGGFISTGLKVDSAIRLHRLVTIPKRLIQRQLGVLSPTHQQIVEQKLRLLFGL